jgi:pyruvate formate lyase activating enzyme
MNNESKNTNEIRGTVLNIQRYCSHDGPGIRTTVFLKGCSLRCKWCSNPESIHLKPELSYESEKCKGKACSICLKAPFPEGAFYFVEGDDEKSRNGFTLSGRCTGNVWGKDDGK